MRALTLRREPKPLSDLANEEIARRVSDAERTFARLDAEDPARVTREGRSETNLRAMRKAQITIEAGRAELAARQQEAALAQMPVQRSYRDWQDERDAVWSKRQPARAALHRVRAFGHLELESLNLDPSKLTHEEGLELKRLVGQRLAAAFGDDGAQDLEHAELARYELLVGRAAGSDDLFARKRAEQEARGKLAHVKETRHVASLAKRPRLEEPGSVTLPRLAFRWLANDREGAWTVADIGALAAILACFENRDGDIINADYEERDGEPMLVISSGIGGDLRFARIVGGDSVDPMSSGFVRLRPALATLVRNKWLEVSVDTAETTITLGPRAKRCRGQRSD